MITDYSGTAYTYSMITLNPVVFFSINEKYIHKLKYTKQVLKEWEVLIKHCFQRPRNRDGVIRLIVMVIVIMINPDWTMLYEKER